MADRRTPDATLISALRILARDIQSGDGCANACLLEAAQRLAELVEERRWVPVGERLPTVQGDSVWVFDGTDVVIGEYWGTWQSYGASCDREGLNSETLLGITHWTEIREPLPPGPEGQ